MKLCRTALHGVLVFGILVWAFYDVAYMYKNQANHVVLNQEENITASHADKPAEDRPLQKRLSLNPNTTRLCLIHVGKTAGSKISCEIGHWSMCRRLRPKPSALSSVFAGASHMWDGRQMCQNQKVNTFVVSLRNPIERIISWWWYESPENSKGQPGRAPCRIRLYRTSNDTNIKHGNPDGCFGDLEKLALALDGPWERPWWEDQNNAKKNCHRDAWNAITGESPCSNHNRYNYQYYERHMKEIEANVKADSAKEAATESKANKTHAHFFDSDVSDFPVFAMRTEHLQTDWNVLNAALGGEEEDGRFQSKLGFVAETKPQLSEKALTNLCFALCSEIQAYKRFLMMSQNLTPEHVRESITEVIELCPEETYEVRTDCHKATIPGWLKKMG